MPEKNEAEPTSAPERRYGTIRITGKRPLTGGIHQSAAFCDERPNVQRGFRGKSGEGPFSAAPAEVQSHHTRLKIQALRCGRGKISIRYCDR